MSNPSHYDEALSAHVAAHEKANADAFIAPQVFGVRFVDRQFDRHSTLDIRGRGWDTHSGIYETKVHSWHQDVLDSDFANADESFDIRAEAAVMNYETLMIARDVKFARKFFRPEPWEGSLVAGLTTDPLPWGDPIEYLDTLMLRRKRWAGVAMNRLTFGEEAWMSLAENKHILKRCKHAGVKPTPEFVSMMLAESPRILIAGAISSNAYTPRPEASESACGEPGCPRYVMPTMEPVFDPHGLLLSHAADDPNGKFTMRAGETLVWKSRAAEGGTSRTSSFEMPERLNREGKQIREPSERIETETAYDLRVVCPALGQFVANASGRAGN